MIYALNPKNYTNYIMPKKKHKNFFQKKPKFKTLKLQRFTDRKKKTLILKYNQINFVKNQMKYMFLTFV